MSWSVFSTLDDFVDLITEIHELFDHAFCGEWYHNVCSNIPQNVAKTRSRNVANRFDTRKNNMCIQHSHFCIATWSRMKTQYSYHKLLVYIQ